MIREQYSNEVKAGKKAKIAGWVHEKRDLGKLIFLVLRDREGVIQLTAKRGDVPARVFKALKDVSKESFVKAEGKAVKSVKAPGGVEVTPSKFEVVAAADSPLPLEVSGKIESNLDKRLDWKFLDMRRKEVMDIFRLQSRIVKLLNNFMQEHGFVRIFSSRLTGAPTEGGTNYFPLVYFNKEAFLAQSPQFYKESVLASGIDKVYEIGFVYRAEPHHTPRHLCEYTSYDFEMACESMDEVMDYEKKLIRYLFLELNKSCRDILDAYKVKLKIPKTIPVIPVDEAIKIIKKRGVKTEGHDLSPEGEREICEYCREKYGTSLVFITDYWWRDKPFYAMKKKEDQKLAYSFDLLYRGQEVTTGGQREHRYEQLVKQIKERGLKLEDYDHIRFFRYGMPPHGGLAIGVERIVSRILNLENIREASLTPRDPTRLRP